MQKTIRQLGFTLIEIMVVLVIVGLFVGLVSTITMPDDKSALRLETDRLAQLLDLGRSEARFSGKRIAWTSNGTDYRFWRRDGEGGWNEIRDVDSLGARNLPRGMKITALKIENSPPAETFRLEFAPAGSVLAFRMDLQFGDLASAIAGSPIGDIAVVADERENDASTMPK